MPAVICTCCIIYDASEIPKFSRQLSRNFKLLHADLDLIVFFASRENLELTLGSSLMRIFVERVVIVLSVNRLHLFKEYLSC